MAFLKVTEMFVGYKYKPGCRDGETGAGGDRPAGRPCRGDPLLPAILTDKSSSFSYNLTTRRRNGTIHVNSIV